MFKTLYKVIAHFVTLLKFKIDPFIQNFDFHLAKYLVICLKSEVIQDLPVWNISNFHQDKLSEKNC